MKLKLLLLPALLTALTALTAISDVTLLISFAITAVVSMS